MAKQDSPSARLARLATLGRAQGWRVVRVERFGGGVHLDLVRGEFHARYTLGKGFGSEFVDLSVAGPVDALPSPSAAKRSNWSPEKRRYVKQANASCSRALARMTADKDQAASALRAAERELAALPAPRGEKEQVATFLRPLRRLAAATEALAKEKGEDVLPLAVGVGLFATRFNKAASRYGLDRCIFG